MKKTLYYLPSSKLLSKDVEFTVGFKKKLSPLKVSLHCLLVLIVSEKKSYKFTFCFVSLYIIFVYSLDVLKIFSLSLMFNIVGIGASQMVQAVKNPLANAGDAGWEDPLEKDMTTHSSILAWKIP